MDWEKVRKINIKNLKIGDIIDFRKENCNWRKGVISNFNYESG